MQRTESRRPRRIGGLLLTALMTAGTVVAQRPPVVTFDVDSGLPSAEIFDLEQDFSGRLWILSRAGIAVYDGHEFTLHASPDETHGSRVDVLEIDTRGRLWAATSTVSGQLVSYLDGSEWQTLPPVTPRLAGAVKGLAVVHRGDREFVAVASHGGDVSVWDGDGWTKPSLQRSADRVYSMVAIGEEIFLGTARGLHVLPAFHVDGSSPGSDPRLRDQIIAMAADGSDRLWLLASTWLGFLTMDSGSEVQVVTEGFELGYRVSCAITVDRGGGIWFGNRNQLLFLDPISHRVRRLTRRQGLVGDGVMSLLRDRESQVWIGGFRGLSQIGSQRFLSFDQDQGLLQDEVSSIVERAPGDLILGHDTGLTFLVAGEEPRSLRFERPISGPPNSYRVLDMAVDGRGGVWLAAHQMGLVRLTRPSALRRVELPITEEIYSVEIEAGGRIWANSPRNLFVDEGSGFSRVDLGRAGAVALRWLTATRDGRLFVATTSGVLWLEDGTWHSARGPHADADNVYDVFVTPSGEIWAGTRGGLYRIQGQELVEVEEGTLDIDRPIYFILQDRDERIWFGTDDGALVWDGRRLRQLTVRHGLAGRETNRGAGLVDHLGRIWIGTDRGVSVYQKPYDVEKTAAPSVEIRSLEVEGSPWTPAADVRLAHHQNMVAFRVRAVSFARDEAVHFRYRLEGFDDDWLGPSPLSGDEIRYTNLAPGRYRFRISAGWPEGPWGREAVSATILIARPLWRQPWFLGALVLFAIGSAWGVHGLRMRAVRVRNAALEKLNAKLAANVEELETANAERERLIAELERFNYTVSHDLKSPLVTVKGFLGLLEVDAARGDSEQIRQDIEQIKKASDQMGRLLDDLLDLSRIGQVANPSEIVALSDMAREMADQVIGQHTIEVEIAPRLPTVFGDRVRLSEVFQNLFENAVKYMGDQPSPRIEVGVRDENVVYVRDNGMGIEPPYHEKIFGLFERLDAQVEGTGVGLALVKRIVESHGGRIWVESEGLGRGSTFCFVLDGIET